MAKKGPPPYAPTPSQRREVELLVGYGLKHHEIAHLTTNPDTGKGISVSTLHRRFKEELDAGRPKMQSELVRSLARRAMDPDHPQGAASAMFLLKTQFGYREKVQVEGGDKPIEHRHTHTLDPALLAVPQREAMRVLLDEPDPQQSNGTTGGTP